MASAVRFFLGTHETSWLSRARRPLFISRVRLAKRVALPRARAPWALDSGGYTALDQPPHRWVLPPEDYAAEVQRYAEQIGGLMWAAPQDWMCEPWILEKTGLLVADHQERTVQNYLDLSAYRRFIPVLQGYTYEDYARCIELYEQAGVDLRAESVVGLGTVCRRQATDEIESLITQLAAHGLNLHGFGIKKFGLSRYGKHLVSADSMAWSADARRTPIRLDGHPHINCANCFEYAMQWAEAVDQRLSPAR